ncbi:glycoside hydrolase family 36 protein [Anaerobranca gottschalkii]|uniref:Alpha-galactosidase n=1 Tax=Anaerobranca gottschalkii DSM 13577 TaxID=1120990 RepID=A0A1I0BQ14_9FIRM|nr:glycoside hydrolase family 36 protein [Anaerobranca gottschalkii]SET09133.1 alpha-galactosidase [Anaerobranca gottschalkii DSM 13577]
MELNLVYRYTDRVKREKLSLGQRITTDILRLSFTKGDKDLQEYCALLTFNEEFTLLDFYVEIPHSFSKEDRVLLNGWQTWTETREWSIYDKNPSLNPLFNFLLGSYGDYRFTDYKNSLNSWSYSYLRKENNYLFFGGLQERDGYIKISYYPKENKIRISKDACGLTKGSGILTLKFTILEGKEEEVFSNYFNILGYPLKGGERVFGWTSWYNYYTSISEKIILENLENFSKGKVPIDIFQIDDGYQQQVGDWLEVNDKFPNGMKYIRDKIAEKGYKAGIWIAPFVCNKKSRIYQKHYNWVAKDRKGKPIVAGFNPLWGGFFYALDFYNPQVQEYLREVFSTVFHKWNYDMVKLDFLYAVTLLKYKGKTKGEMMQDAMEFLRECGKDKLLLGCGVPLSSSYNLVDYCRIGPDVGLTWEDRFLKAIHYKERISTINSLQNTLWRRWLNNRVFKNDPDVFIIREGNQKMTLNERKVLLYLNILLGGLIFTSDNIGEYDETQLDLYLSTFKYKNAKILEIVIDSLVYIEVKTEQGKELFIFNLGDEKREVKLPQALQRYVTLVPRELPPRNVIQIPIKDK